MKSKWVLILLIASLALNAGALAAFGFLTVRRWQHGRDLFRFVNDRGARQRLTALVREHQPKMDSLRNEYWQARQQLAELGFQNSPDPKLVEAALDRIALLHKEMNRLAFATETQLWELTPPDRRGRLQERWRHLMARPHRPGRHFWRRH